MEQNVLAWFALLLFVDPCELCYVVEQIFMHESIVFQLKAPVKVFGDLHGQFAQLGGHYFTPCS